VFFGSISLENVYNHVNVNTELEISCSVLGTPNTARKKLIKKQEKKGPLTGYYPKAISSGRTIIQCGSSEAIFTTAATES